MTETTKPIWYDGSKEMQLLFIRYHLIYTNDKPFNSL